jgi:histidinol-phosphate aminotransferase
VLQSLYLAFAGPGRTVSVFEPSSVHDQLVRMSGASVRSVHSGSVSDDVGTLTLNPHESGRLPDLVVVDRPNHYNGTAVSHDQVLALVEEMASGLVVINEERGEFLTQSASELVENDRSLAVVRSFSRTLPLAGLGFGYLVGPRQVVAGLMSVVLPYHLDVIRQHVGLILLSELEEISRRTKALICERERVSRALTGLGVQVLPSEADFVVFESPTAKTGLGRELASLSVHIEVVEAPSQLCGWIMASVGSRSSNDALLRAVANSVVARKPIEA